MPAIAASKSRSLNTVEGIALIAIFQAVPNFVAAVLLLRLAGIGDITSDGGATAIFVALAALFYAFAIPFLASLTPNLAAGSYEPLYFDPRLSFAEKLLCWRTSPNASLRLLITAIVLSLLAVAVILVG